VYAIIFHAHQKLDRVARRHLEKLLPQAFFPDIRQILKFEAGHGPDGAKLKRQKTGEQPWHFIDPHDTTDTQLYSEIEYHYKGLAVALKRRDEVRSAFEAAWLAHALVDGLTPAHHYPYEQMLEELRGESRNTRRGLAGRLYVRGETVSSSVMKSLKLVGPKGLLTSHAMFEAGAYTLIAPLTLKKDLPVDDELRRVVDFGVVDVFKSLAREIAEMDIYDRFCILGWKQNISQDVRREMAPRMVKMITLAWYAACHEAGLVPA
jgi:hypothetical protein